MSMTLGAGGTDEGGGRGVPRAMTHRLESRLGSWTLEQFLVLAGFITMVLSGLALASSGLSLLVPALLLPGAIFTGVLLWKPLPWTYLAAGIANSIVAIFAIPFGLVAVLLNPFESRYGGFVLASLALLLALPAGISGFLQGRLRSLPRPLRQGIRSRHGIAAIALVALTAGALAAGIFAQQHVPLGEGEAIDFSHDTRIISIAENRFQPSSFNVTVGVVTRIIVLNEDDSLHTFTYALNGTSYSHDAPGGGGTARFVVLFSSPATIPFWSVSPGDEAMRGNITVVPGR